MLRTIQLTLPILLLLGMTEAISSSRSSHIQTFIQILSKSAQ